MLRKQKMQERDSLSAEMRQAFSDIITNKVIELEEYKQAETILCYVSCRREVRSVELIENSLKEGKAVGVPKVEGDDMCFYKIMSMDDLEPGYFGVLEPKTCKPIEETNNSLVIVPGLVFDLDLNRIGYGKGFYDRYFQKAETVGNSLIKCGISYDMQICDRIETNQYDRHLDMIITEKRIIRKKIIR